MKVCNKNPSELKIEMIDQYMDSLKNFEQQLNDHKKNAQTMRIRIETIYKTYYEWEKSVKQ